MGARNDRWASGAAKPREGAGEGERGRESACRVTDDDGGDSLARTHTHNKEFSACSRPPK